MPAVLGTYFLLLPPGHAAGRCPPARPGSLCVFFSAFVVHFFLLFLFCLFIRCILFSAFLLPSFFAFVGRGAAVCTTGKSPEARISSGFARAFIFLKIFLKIVFYSVYFSAYYICNEMKKT
nr:MAG TPA: hypothetical protein [Caudoviricetes sp.]